MLCQYLAQFYLFCGAASSVASEIHKSVGFFIGCDTLQIYVGLLQICLSRELGSFVVYFVAGPVRNPVYGNGVPQNRVLDRRRRHQTAKLNGHCPGMENKVRKKT